MSILSSPVPKPLVPEFFSEDVMEKSSERKDMVLREAADFFRPEICNSRLFNSVSIGTLQ